MTPPRLSQAVRRSAGAISTASLARCRPQQVSQPPQGRSRSWARMRTLGPQRDNDDRALPEEPAARDRYKTTQTQPGDEQERGENPNADRCRGIFSSLDERVVHEGIRETQRQNDGNKEAWNERRALLSLEPQPATVLARLGYPEKHEGPTSGPSAERGRGVGLRERRRHLRLDRRSFHDSPSAVHRPRHPRVRVTKDDRDLLVGEAESTEEPSAAMP